MSLMVPPAISGFSQNLRVANRTPFSPRVPPAADGALMLSTLIEFVAGSLSMVDVRQTNPNVSQL